MVLNSNISFLLALLFLVCSAFSQNLREDFGDNSRAWSLSMSQTADNLGFISDGQLNLERVNPYGASFYVNQNIKVDVSKDFTLSTKIDSRFKGLGYQGVLLKNDRLEDYVLFALDSFGVARGISHSEYEDVELFNYDLGVVGEFSVNEFHIVRSDNNLVFRLGNRVLGVKRVPESFKSNYSVGYYMSQKQSAKIDYLELNSYVKKTKNKSQWYYPSKDLLVSLHQEPTLKFTVKQPYMYQSLVLNVNGKKTDLHKFADDVKYSESYYFSMKTPLKKGVNSISLEYLDHNNFFYKDYKTITVKRSFEEYKNHALLFATDDYKYWDDLNNPISDMDSLASVLEGFYGFEVEVVRNASKVDVMKKINAYTTRSYNPDEQLLVFFAGHGTYNMSNDASYFVCPDSRQGFVDPGTLVSLQSVERLLDKSMCRNICLMTDICFGGKSGSAEIERKGIDTGASRYFMASGRDIVSDGASLNGVSPFMNELFGFLVERKNKKSLDLQSWVYSLQQNNVDIVFRKFGSGANVAGHNFKFILK